MPPTKTRRYNREEHLAKVAGLYALGMPQIRIAEQLSVARSQITYDLKKLHARWCAQAQIDYDREIGRQIDMYDTMIAELWEAWEKSKQPYEETSTSQIQGKEPKASAAVKRRQQYGDVGIMNTILATLDQRNRLIGIYPKDAPDRGNVGSVTSIAWWQQLLADASVIDAESRDVPA